MFGPSNAPPSSVVLVSPRMIAPAAFSLATIVESAAGWVSCSAIEPRARRQTEDVHRVIDDHRDAGQRPEGFLRMLLGSQRVALERFVDRLRVDVADRLERRPVGVGQGDPVQLGLHQLPRGQRLGLQHFLERRRRGGFQRERQEPRLLADVAGHRVVVRVAVTAARERLRRERVGAAVHRRVDVRHRLAQFQRLFDHVAHADHVELVVGAAGDADADRPPLRRRVAARHDHQGHPRLRSARHRADDGDHGPAATARCRSSFLRSPPVWLPSPAAGWFRILSGFCRRRRLRLLTL